MQRSNIYYMSHCLGAKGLTSEITECFYIIDEMIDFRKQTFQAYFNVCDGNTMYAYIECMRSGHGSGPNTIIRINF